MLPFHIVHPEKRQQNDSQFVHYLSLGSYSTSFNHSNILSFSKITLNPKKHLPKLNYDDLKTKCESSGYKFNMLVIPLYGNFSIDQITVLNVLEQEINEKDKQQNNNQDTFKISQLKYVLNPQYITNKQDKDKNAVFLYVLLKTPAGQSESEDFHLNRFSALVQQKALNIHPVNIGSSSVHISLIQSVEDTKLSLNPNDLVYLQKGKVTLYMDEQQDQIEIRNKGNRKGEQNYIENMFYISERTDALIEKGSLLFLISSKEAHQ